MHIKDTIKALCCWPLWGESTSDWWILLTKGQWCGRCSHLITSSWLGQVQPCSIWFQLACCGMFTWWNEMFSALSAFCKGNHDPLWGNSTSYWGIPLTKDYNREALVAWLHQAITCTNVVLSSMVFSDTQQIPISWKVIVQIAPMSFQTSIPHKPQQVEWGYWGEVLDSMVTEWPSACLHKLCLGGHQTATKEKLKWKKLLT